VVSVGRGGIGESNEGWRYPGLRVDTSLRLFDRSAKLDERAGRVVCRVSRVKEPPLVRIELSPLKLELTIIEVVGLAKFELSLGRSVVSTLRPPELRLRGSLNVVG
jgi:hypothetical protein